MIFTFVMLPLIKKEFEANEISTLKILTINIDTLNNHGKRMERSKYHATFWIKIYSNSDTVLHFLKDG